MAERREQRAAEWQGRTQDTRTATAQQLDAGGRSSQPVADGTTLPGPGAVAFNQEKVLVGAFFVIVKTDCETDGFSAALGITAPASSSSTTNLPPHCTRSSEALYFKPR